MSDEKREREMSGLDGDVIVLREGVEVVCDSVSEDKQPSTKKSIAMITQEKVEEDLASTNALTER